MNLAITEVVPSIDQVEVTNMGTAPVTLSGNYPFCHRFNYSSSIPSGTTFAAGESKVFTVSSLNATNSDLWLYRPGSFGSASNIISGLNWGASLLGRTNLATGANKWDGQSLTAPDAGNALALSEADVTSSTSWSTNVSPNLNSFSLPDFQADLISISNTTATLNWKGGKFPFQVQSSTMLTTGTWQNEETPTSSRSKQITLVEDRKFYRILSEYNEPDSVEYQVTFNATWSSNTHQNFPNGAHFSSLIGATHQSNVRFWEVEGTATSGIESMAETGGTSTLRNEINAAITNQTAERILSGSGIGSPGSHFFRFNVSQDFPLVTLVTMIAPSPDWFVGVSSLPLFQDGQWREQVVVSLYPYDSGTDSGTNFTSSNADTNPQEPIFLITGLPFDEEGQVAPLGTFTFSRVLP